MENCRIKTDFEELSQIPICRIVNRSIHLGAAVVCWVGGGSKLPPYAALTVCSTFLKLCNNPVIPTKRSAWRDLRTDLTYKDIGSA